MGQRAVIYCRLSTANQSCARQEDELKRLPQQDHHYLEREFHRSGRQHGGGQ